MIVNTMDGNADLIHFSRAGDIFHYRWAVKRCLKLLEFKTELIQITIEGSNESALAGECVVDLAEYRQSSDGTDHIDYYQLKHSSVRVYEPFTPSKLVDTLRGFADRYIAFKDKSRKQPTLTFTILTNRKISDNFKRNIKRLADGDEAPEGFTKKLQKYTKLDGKELNDFCRHLKLDDSEGNYDIQKSDIHKELHHLAVSKNVSDREKLLVAKVWEKIEPGKSKILKREDMLEAFDAISIDDFFPAPPLFEPISYYVHRQQQKDIANRVKQAKTHTVITASGGSGKSILANNIETEFDENTVVVPYDCFGNGSYRKVSSQRHETKQAYTQIVNTLATLGLCDQVIPSRNEPDEHWTKLFLRRIQDACNSIEARDSNSLLVIVFDAADNAEMAAEEHGSKCFASQLLRESVPINCRLVFTCRPERLILLDPPNSLLKLELKPFSNEETLENLLPSYPTTTMDQALEFNRLTGGNPRVQSNALSLKKKKLKHLLLSFDSKIITVEDLIARQVEQTISNIKDEFPQNYRKSIDSICTGLAVLPPFVPISVLAAVAGVSKESVESFIADLGNALWQIDDVVQFRDEPTEKWFQDNFVPSLAEIKNFISEIKSLTSDFSYVSETLPALLLKANMLDELVELALSEEYLPENSEYDDNQVKVQRLQYAFKAALKAKKTHEAVKLALLAGEKIAGTNRQLDIIKNNIDLSSIFLGSSRVQGIAHKKELSGNWDGSETIYSASLLSTIPLLKGESLSYLRSADHWLNRHFERLKESKKELYDERLEDLDTLELAHTIFRLKGYRACLKHLFSWTPPSYIFKTSSSLIRRLIDFGDFKNIELMANYGKDEPSFVLAVASELIKIGKAPPKTCLVRCLNKIIKPSSRLEKPGDDIYERGFSNDTYLSFFEACVIKKLPLVNIRRGLNYYYVKPALYRVAEEHQFKAARENFLRYLSLIAILKNNFSLNLTELIPKSWIVKDSTYEDSRMLDRAKDHITKLAPWYIIRAKILVGTKINLRLEHENAKDLSSKNGENSYRDYEPIPFESTKAIFQNILFCNSDYLEELQLFSEDYKEQKLKIQFVDELYFLRCACRTDKLLHLSETIEDQCYLTLKNYDYEDSPESRSENLVTLARAVLTTSIENAQAYFDIALNKATDFGEEGVLRWEALTTIAKRTAEAGKSSSELAHRYIRCAEMIGDSVAREKYWDRSDAVATCFQLSSISAFPALYRWKDRKVGWHARLIKPLAHMSLNSGLLTSATVWALSAFDWDYSLDDFLAKCLAEEPSKLNQQKMMDHYVRDQRVRGVTGKIWLKVWSLANKFQLNSITESELEILSQENERNNTENPLPKKDDVSAEERAWDGVFGNFDLLSNSGFAKAYQKLQEQSAPKDTSQFWRECFKKVTRKRLVTFLKIIAQSELLNFFKLRWAYEQIPEGWKKDASVERNWNSIIKQIATRFPSDFTNIYEKKYMLKYFILDKHTEEEISKGVSIGLSNSVDIESASALFNYANYSAKKLNGDQAYDLIDFGLTRLEKFIDNEYADGVWNTSTKLPVDLDQGIACYIYANLGSPFSEERWRAVHAVLRLYELGCQSTITQLLSCLELGLLNSFVPPKYSFYDLHAKLYLLIAINRCAHSSTKLLESHSGLMSRIAINKQEAVLFQYYAKKICLVLQKNNANIFNNELFEAIDASCLSPFPILAKDEYSTNLNINWQMDAETTSFEDINFGYDFEKQRLRPLARVFGVSVEQLKELAGYIYTTHWGKCLGDSNQPDPRAEIWRSGRYSHSLLYPRHRFPSIDTDSFYTEYHLLLVIASRLLESMPVVKRLDDDTNPWNEWLKEYTITNTDKILLAELRDPIPLKKPEWLSQKVHDDWQWQIQASSFLDHLLVSSGTDFWLHVEGDWHYYQDSKSEDISFSTILIPKELSHSFLITISNYQNQCYEVNLYDFCDYGYSQRFEDFCGRNWLFTKDFHSELETKDPFAGTIEHRPVTIAKLVGDKIGLTSTDHHKTSLLTSDNSVCLQNVYWSEDKPNDTDSYISSGKPVKASLKLLKLICNELDVDIAIQVNIKRSYTHSHRNGNDNDKLGYIPNYSKTFILSGNGELRDLRKCYQLGKDDTF